MSGQAKTVLIDAFPQSAFRHLQRDALVCVDVMLTTTTLVSAVASGRQALVAATPEEARSLAARQGPALMAGDIEDAFEIPDSPTALESRHGDPRPLVLVSPRRWRGIEPSLAALGNSADTLRRAGREVDVDFVLNHMDDVPLACACTGDEVHAVREQAPAAAIAVTSSRAGQARGSQ